MDNLGEAQDVNKGLWPADQPIGSHYSVKEQLPRMLRMLARHNIKGTYFCESWSLSVYPGAVRDLQDQGHEVAWHGYQHESWGGLSAEDERANFDKSFEAARQSELGVKQGITILPFEWKTVDAFYYMEKFSAIRQSHGETAAPLSPSDFESYLLAKIDEVIASRGYISILFHPFLQTSEEKLAVMETILGRLSRDPTIWCAPCGEVASWVATHPSAFA
ncbi:unnamed protein product [Parascedosporium putredinis]|uniref:NodB homology domain-containing protein n=1 Tax=Parascedosporium putredinis TaxID=1442378 RepID=A0A9P1GZP4_9PEZI|nr:unnamed protein product [Parascedosporium putredinis]CAI7991041.1 unnamed protein product [Parascedosporium putredinis]